MLLVSSAHHNTLGPDLLPDFLGGEEERPGSVTIFPEIVEFWCFVFVEAWMLPIR